MILNRISLLFFVLIVLVTLSCKIRDKPKYDNEKLLLDYLKSKQNLEIVPNKIYNIAIMQIGMCGACTEFNKTKIVEYFSRVCELSLKVLILSDKNEKLEQYFLNNCGNDVIIQTGNGIDIPKYGLRYSKDVLIKIKDASVFEYTFLEGK